ncbi:4-hydroxybenzoate octaprenyltransferase [Pelagovum pacificum]|uniref:4-hydroxybenzoate octaprenyltransferase n=1 Tax=Pelagovum pacificum TaxID=2588711 RepID=A0A5C5GCD1_9RHOB|nr:4-hydroxybenzoate octaprenyltransferase [Pelagovum pacificum]QQA42538.1 4-hydroxybenzoate octaprenyltransferase [Pelagovum pacificum]TNY31622.1 4-hydroxybenzoate octaprenyltransferase [Pelagovum pacificum]
MTDERAVPDDSVADAVKGNWVDHKAPAALRPYLRLSRIDRPIGTWLLLLPCWWGLGLGALQKGSFTIYDLWIGIGCAIGAVLMRGAGCTWNDITDRDIDGSVSRTAKRPIPSGQVKVRMALGWMLAQSLVALLILLTFNWPAILLGFLSILPVAVYPFAKRFTWWPQVFLGLAFNWGALLTFTATTGYLGWPAVVAYIGGICWTLFYDTVYAYQDAEDDALIGVKSTARLFGDTAPTWLRRFLVGTVILLSFATILATIDRSVLSLVIAVCGCWAMGWHLTWQLVRFDSTNNDRLLALFRSNRNAGLIPVLFFAVAGLV